MAYREVGMLEIHEVLRLWLAARVKKPIARQLGLDPKTVRRYSRAAEACGLQPGMAETELTEGCQRSRKVSPLRERTAPPDRRFGGCGVAALKTTS